MTLLSPHLIKLGSLPKFLLTNTGDKKAFLLRIVQQRLKSTDKKASHVEFSKSASYPTRTTLEKTVGIPRRMSNKSFRSGLVTFGIPVTCMLIAFYTFFLSSYNFKMEEKLCELVPGYEEDMNKVPGYREEMAKQKTLQKRREMAKKKLEAQKQE